MPGIESRIWMCAGAALLLAVAISCSSCGSTEPDPYDIAAALNRGWTHFAEAEYQEAIGEFNNVLAHSHSNQQAFLGKGWCYAFLGDLDSSLIFLDDASEAGLNSADLNMAFAVVYRDLPDYSQGIGAAQEVIEADSAYQFSKKPTIDFKDAHLIKAECHFHIGSSEFDNARTEINFLCRELGIAELPAGEGPSYEVAIAQKLEQISAIIAD